MTTPPLTTRSRNGNSRDNRTRPADLCVLRRDKSVSDQTDEETLAAIETAEAERFSREASELFQRLMDEKWKP